MPISIHAPRARIKHYDPRAGSHCGLSRSFCISSKLLSSDSTPSRARIAWA